MSFLNAIDTIIYHGDGFKSVAFSLDGKWLALGSGDLLDVHTQAKIATFKRFRDVEFSPDGRFLSLSHTNGIKLLELAKILENKN